MAPTLNIEIKGIPQIIPTNIGISGAHYPIHTHDSTGTLHYENQQPTFENMRLGYFFKIWGKKFSSICIFDYCNGNDGSIKMFVNGKENLDFENYIPKDKDEIRIGFS